MAIEVRDQQRKGYGSQRLIVRGQRYLDLSRAQWLRALYNEYPERYPYDPRFPMPGKRGASRPASQPGETAGATPAEVGPSPEEAGAMLPPIQGIYPARRPRGPVEIAPAEIPGMAGAAGAGGICELPRGATYNHLQAVAATSTVIFQGATIDGPFVVTHFLVSHDRGVNSDLGIKLLVTPGPNPGAASDQTGIPIVRDAFDRAVEVDPEISAYEGYPNLHIGQGPHHFKFVFRNGGGAGAEFQAMIDVIFT